MRGQKGYRISGVTSVLLGIVCIPLVLGATEESQRLFEMDLESLTQIKVADSSATLIDVDRKYIPSMVTTITQEQIRDSGARSLDELLEIFVPDMAYMIKVDGNQLGIGGIISDRNNKILLTLNGELLNIKGRDGGAVVERWFSMLGDIEEIQVISGPGSVIYGPGAIAGVINIKTFNTDTFTGLSTQVKGGYKEAFFSADVKYGKRIFEDWGLFLYAGIDDYQGVNKREVVNKFAFDYPEGGIYANRPFNEPAINLNGSYNGTLREKLYLSLQGENLTFWTRYTHSGLALPTYQYFYPFVKPDAMIKTGTQNRQWSSSISYHQQWDDWEVDYSLSHIRSSLEKRNVYKNAQGVPRAVQSEREDTTNLKLLSKYEASMYTAFALGMAYSYNQFHRYQNPYILVFNKARSWYTESYSLYGEMHHTDEYFETLLDFRVDDHTYTDALYSYRIAETWKIHPDHTLKASYSRSVRHMDEIDMFKQVVEMGAFPDVESIDRFEILYNYDSDHWGNYLRYAYNIHDIVAYNYTMKQIALIGQAKFYTLEGKIGYQGDGYHVVLSHSYTDLVNFSPINGPIPERQNISASAYGYGSDFANWHKQITKLRFGYEYDDQLSFYGSLRLFWGLDGAVDFANYNKETFQPLKENGKPNTVYYKLPLYKDSTKAFKANAYLNLSLRYKLDEKTTLSVHAYNLLGLFDKDVNKRNYFQTTSNYFDEVPAVAVGVAYRF